MADDQSGEPRSRDVLVCVLAVQVVFALTAGAAVILDPSGVLDHPGARVLAGVLVLMPVAVAAAQAIRFHRSYRSGYVPLSGGVSGHLTVDAALPSLAAIERRLSPERCRGRQW